MTNPYAKLSFPQLPDRPYTIVNMVTTVDGKAVSPDKDHPLFGGQGDRSMMLELRAHADGLLYGATTGQDVPPEEFVDQDFQARRKALGTKPLMPFIMLSHSTHLTDQDRIFGRPEVTPIIYAPGNVSLSLTNAEVRTSGEVEIDLPQVMTDLKQEGINTLLCEGGPGTNYPLLLAGLVDEFFVTVSPKIFGGQAIKTIVEGELLPPDCGRLQLLSTMNVGSEAFLRYKVLR